MGETSSLVFRSNIYPTTRNAQLINDPEFLASIYDPEALNVLWHFNGSRGRYLNPRQRKVHETAVHCVHAVAGDYPWGTPVGENRVVCRCEREECLSFTACTGKPGKASHAVNTDGDERPTRRSMNRKVVAKRTGVSKSGRTPNGIDEDQWGDQVSIRTLTQDEVARLANFLAKCTREQLYNMFPDRTSADVDREFERLGLAWVLDLASARQRREDEKRNLQESQSSRRDKSQQTQKRGSGNRRQGKSAQNASSNGHQGPTQNKGKKKRKKGNKRAKSQFKPWSVNEDVAIRHNYPAFGSNMSLWDRRLPGRTAAEIEGRAEVLGVRHAW